MIHKGISPQYLKKERINVTILDIIDPAHFVIKECPDLSNESSVATSFLEAEAAMQQYYDSVDPGFIQLPLKDTIIVVLYEGKFYRARVVRILTKSAGHLFKVYLVDYGIECTVSQENIYKIEKDFDFVEHPFQAATIELLGIKPISLVMDEISITVAYGPVSSWDPSTLIYLKELTKNMCSAYIEVQGADDSQLYGKLFFCFESSPTKCINDDLITKSFACFNEDCWKNIKTIESILDGGNENIETPNSQSRICKNENSGKLPLIDSLTKVESDDIDFTVKFINPADGKVLAESTLSRNTSDTADAMSENESVSLEETKPHLHKSEIKSPSSVEEKSSETEVQQIPRKTLMKLQQLKRKSISSCKDSVIGDTVKTMTEKSISVDTCTVESKILNDRLSDTRPNTNCQSQTPSEDVKETCKNNQENCWSKSLSQQIANKRFMKLQQQLLKKKSLSPHKSSDIDCCGGLQALEKTTVADRNTPNLSSEKIPHDILNHSLSNEVIQSETLKETVDETAKSSQKQENVSLNQLIARKRFMKLQQLKLNRKSLSPHKSSDSDLSEEQAGLAKTTVSAVNLITEEIPPVSLNETLPNKMVQSKTPKETTVEAAKNIQEQENVNLVFLENKKQLENLQQKIRINKKEPMIITSNEETNTFQKDDDLLCDSDSGYNAYSSSSSTSDKIE